MVRQLPYLVIACASLHLGVSDAEAGLLSGLFGGSHGSHGSYGGESHGSHGSHGGDYGSHGGSYGSHGSHGASYGSYGGSYGSYGGFDSYYGHGSHGSYGGSYGGHGGHHGSHGSHGGYHGSYGGHYGGHHGHGHHYSAASPAHPLYLAGRGAKSSVFADEETGTASILVSVPDAETDVYFQGQKLNLTGLEAQCVTPPLVVGRDYHYTVRVVRGGLETTRVAEIRAGSTFELSAVVEEQGLAIHFGDSQPQRVAASLR